MAVNKSNVPNYVNYNRMKNYFTATVVLIVIGIFIAFFYFYKTYDYNQKRQNFLKTDAVVVDHKYKNNKVVSTVVEYTVNEKKYTTSHNFRSLNIQPYGSTITILYNPNHPEIIATLDGGISALLLWFAGFIIFLGLASCMFILNRRSKIRNDLINKRYQVSAVDAELSNNFVNQNAVKTIPGIISDPSQVKDLKIENKANDINAIMNDIIGVSNTEPAQESVNENSPVVNNIEVKQENIKPVEQKEVVNNTSAINNMINTENSIINDQVPDFIPKSNTKTINTEPAISHVDMLINEYSGLSLDNKDYAQDVIEEEDKKFEFITFADKRSVKNTNLNEVSSFIPNIDEVEDKIRNVKSNK